MVDIGKVESVKVIGKTVGNRNVGSSNMSRWMGWWHGAFPAGNELTQKRGSYQEKQR